MADRSLAAPTSVRIRAFRSNPKRSRLLSLSASLQDRDREICLALHERKVLTTYQICELFFGSHSRTKSRMVRLYRAGIVDRFSIPAARGSAPNHYLLGDVGTQIVAGELGLELRDVLRSRNRVANMVTSQHLRHHVEVNGFFTRLIWACRQIPGYDLLEWSSEEKVGRLWGEVVRPDGFGRLQGDGRSRSFFLEFDRGTETSEKLTHKLAGYQEASLADNSSDVVLFCFQTQGREASARRVLRPSRVPIATTTVERHRSDPLGRIWLPTTNGRRLSLLEVNGHE